MREFLIKKSLFCIVLFCSVAFSAERTAPAQSLIIPMGSTYQDNAAGIYEAYGFVFDLLAAGGVLHWAISDTKTTITSPDFTVADMTVAINGVIAGPRTTPVNYIGGPWVIEAGTSTDLALSLLTDPKYQNISVHQSTGAFTYYSSRLLKGVPPRLGLVNDQESTTSGNAIKILACYLGLAQIGSSIYDVLTPNMVRDGALQTGGYSLVWVPHWVAFDHPDVDIIMQNFSDYVDGGNALFAECASIESFEHHPTASFLATNDFGHDGGTNNNADIVYLDLTQPYVQIGDYPYNPIGGHLHNWRPYQSGDSSLGSYGFNNPPTTNLPSRYISDVTVFTSDLTGTDINPQIGWDYFIGGHRDNNPAKGYVIYLGGHSYCKGTSGTSSSDPSCELGTMKIKLKERCRNSKFWENGDMSITLNYSNGGSTTIPSLQVQRMNPTVVVDSTNLMNIDFQTATFKDTEVKDITITSQGSSNINITQIEIAFPNSDCSKWTFDSVEFEFADKNKFSSSKGDSSPITERLSNKVEICPSSGGSGGGQSAMNPNTAGIRYVLNTLFNLQFDAPSLNPREYARSTPIVTAISDLKQSIPTASDFDMVLFGTFSDITAKGHYRAWKIEDTGELTMLWDAADETLIKPYASRFWFTFAESTDAQGVTVFERIPIKYNGNGTQPAFITAALGNPVNPDEVIGNILGKGQKNWFGAIHQSTGAVVGQNNRTPMHSTRPAIAYTGTSFGTLEFINLLPSDMFRAGQEITAFVPAQSLANLPNILGSGQGGFNSPFPILDASPTVVDVFVKVHNASERTWRTILTMGHRTDNGSFALDVTNPLDPQMLWQKTTDSDGITARVVVAQYKKPILDQLGNIVDHTLAYAAVASATGGANFNGIQVHAMDAYTGEFLPWSPYQLASTVNEVPPGVSVYDSDGDFFDDRILVASADGTITRLDLLTGRVIGAPDTSTTQATPLNEPIIIVGNDPVTSVLRPILATPSVGTYQSHRIMAYGTGGADWVTSQNNFVAVYDLNSHSELFRINILDRKLYAPVLILENEIIFQAVKGSVKSPDPANDLPGSASDLNDLYTVSLALDASGNRAQTITKVAKSNSSVSQRHGQSWTGDISAGENTGKVTAPKQPMKKEKLKLDFLIWKHR